MALDGISIKLKCKNFLWIFLIKNYNSTLTFWIATSPKIDDETPPPLPERTPESFIVVEEAGEYSSVSNMKLGY